MVLSTTVVLPSPVFFLSCGGRENNLKEVRRWRSDVHSGSESMDKDHLTNLGAWVSHVTLLSLEFLISKVRTSIFDL